MFDERNVKHLFVKYAVVFFGVIMFCGLAKSFNEVNEPIMSYKIGVHTAVVPVPVKDEWWVLRHKAIVERVKQGNVDLVFIGDSITQGWEEAGKAVWQKYYADRNALNLGFGGDRTQHVLWRLENGEISNISPKLAVLLIGTNNSNQNDYTAKEISDGIVAICQKLRKDLPDTKILLVSILPRGEKPSPQREKNIKASRLASAIADNKWIYYLDCGEKFLIGDGIVDKNLMPDYLHPNAKGYQVLAESLELIVAKFVSKEH
jgi:beta-glucosidase